MEIIRKNSQLSQRLSIMKNQINFHVLPVVRNKSKNNIEITYDIVKTRFGNSLIGLYGDEVCHISFQDDDDDLSLDKLKANWPGASLVQDPVPIKRVARKVFEEIDGDINVVIRGTDLQISVWKELAKIERGSTVSYEDVARSVGKPKAVRSVASAVARNKIAYLIPCHRVIKKSGEIHKYGSGPERKKEMLSYEGAI